MRDDLHSILARSARTWRRRKRTVIGKDWTTPGLQDVTAGVWCKRCHIRHPYNGKGKLGLNYELRNGKYVLLWLCPISGDVVGERRSKEEDET